jgi:hypothetical protein
MLGDSGEKVGDQQSPCCQEITRKKDSGTCKEGSGDLQLELTGDRNSPDLIKHIKETLSSGSGD